MKFFKVF